MGQNQFPRNAETTRSVILHELVAAELLLAHEDVTTAFPGVGDGGPRDLDVVDEDPHAVEGRRALARVVVPGHVRVELVSDPEIDLESPDTEELNRELLLERRRTVNVLRVVLRAEVHVYLGRVGDHHLDLHHRRIDGRHRHLAVATGEAGTAAVAGVVVHAVGAGPAVLARVRVAVVDVDLAVIAGVARRALAGVAVGLVGAGPTVEAGVGVAVVDHLDRVGLGRVGDGGVRGIGLNLTTGLVGRAESAAGVEEKGQGHEVREVAHSLKPL